MRLFDFFRKKRKARPRRKRSSSRASKARKSVKVQSDIRNIQAQLKTVNILLDRHNEELLEHKKLIGDQSGKLEKLEQIVTSTKTTAALIQNSPPPRPITMVNLPIKSQTPTEDSGQKLDIDRFSEQERRILSVFFQNPGMKLSYVDIASALNKSPCTIKNQMREIRLKADLFNRTRDNDSRNRFKLKDSLKIEKYLQTG